MICARCEAAGERSRIYPGTAEVTLLETTSYWDEDGALVTEDPNTRTQSFRCSNGHNWVTSTLHGETTVEDLADTPE